MMISSICVCVSVRGAKPSHKVSGLTDTLNAISAYMWLPNSYSDHHTFELCYMLPSQHCAISALCSFPFWYCYFTYISLHFLFHWGLCSIAGLCNGTVCSRRMASNSLFRWAVDTLFRIMYGTFTLHIFCFVLHRSGQRPGAITKMHCDEVEWATVEEVDGVRVLTVKVSHHKTGLSERVSEDANSPVLEHLYPWLEIVEKLHPPSPLVFPSWKEVSQLT